jgi:hypothetical protein
MAGYAQLAMRRVRAVAKGEGASMISFDVAGIPQQQGSMRAFVVAGRARVTSDNAKLKPWRNLVSSEAMLAMRDHPLFEGEMDVAILGTPCMDMGQVYAPIEDRRAKDLIAEEGAGFLMLDIAKNRNGATGMVPMRLDWWTGGGRFKGIGA